MGSTARQGDFTCVCSCRQDLGKKGWTQGWNSTKIVQSSAQDPNAQFGFRAWPGRSRGDENGGICSTLLGNIAVVCHKASCPWPLPSPASHMNHSTKPLLLTAQPVRAPLSPGALERVAMHVMSLSGHGKLTIRNTSTSV